jgi:hypothetical protein
MKGERGTGSQCVYNKHIRLSPVFSGARMKHIRLPPVFSGAPMKHIRLSPVFSGARVEAYPFTVGA